MNETADTTVWLAYKAPQQLTGEFFHAPQEIPVRTSVTSTEATGIGSATYVGPTPRSQLLRAMKPVQIDGTTVNARDWQTEAFSAPPSRTMKFCHDNHSADNTIVASGRTQLTREVVMKILGYLERGLINALLYEIEHREREKARELVKRLFLLVKSPITSQLKKALSRKRLKA